MMYKDFFVSSFAAIAIALAGVVSADTAAQEKTEQMLKGEAKALSGDQGGAMPSEVKEATPDAKAQAKTEAMLKEEKDALQGR